MKFLQFLPIKEFGAAKSSIEKTMTIVLLDISFIVTILLLQIISRYLASAISLPQGSFSVPILLIFSCIYYLFLLLVYSFLKYTVMIYIKSYFDKKYFSFRRFLGFYYLNILIVGIFLIMMFLFNYLLAGIKFEYQPYFFIVLAVPCLLLFYFILNFSHFAFIADKNIAGSLKVGFVSILNFKLYKKILLFSLAVLFFLLALFLIIGFLIKGISGKNYMAYLRYYLSFKDASLVIFYIAIYFIVFINRISFFKILKES